MPLPGGSTQYPARPAVAGDSAELASSKFGMLKSVFAGSFLASAAMQGIEAISNGLNNLVSTADEYAGVQARLKLVAGSQENVAYLRDNLTQSELGAARPRRLPGHGAGRSAAGRKRP